MHTQRLTFTIMLYKNVVIRLGNTKYCTSACAMTGEKKVFIQCNTNSK